MALEKSYEMPTGVEGNYWVMSFSVDGINKIVHVKMHLFKDKAARDAKKQPLFVGEFPYNLSEMPQLGSPALTLAQSSAVCYSKIKQEPLWAGAKDV